MAHAKTTPGQIAAQLAAGAAVAGYLFKTFYYDHQEAAAAAAASAQAQPGSVPASTQQQQRQQQQQQAASLVAALDAETARSTAGQVWEAKRAAVDGKR